MLAATSSVRGPHIDWAGISPLVALLGGAIVVLLVGLLRPRVVREQLVPGLAFASVAAALGLTIWQLDTREDLVAGALRLDGLSTVLSCIFCVAGLAAIVLSWRAVAPRESAHGEYFSLMLTALAGMVVLAWAQNTISLFLGLELLSLPLYVLCATEMRRATSLEAGLKYLVIGSVGSATLLYGLALLYGATGTTQYATMAARFGADGGLTHDTLTLMGVALVIVGLCFKGSVAPFHQWTPDVYEGAPTPVTAFMAVATKAAAFGVLLRFMDVALIDVQLDWGPALAALATITIVVGNVGALGQSSLKRLLAWSSVAQAGYLLAGVVVSTQLGVRATVFYLAVYLLMNLAAFAVITARQRETDLGDDLSAVQGLGAERPALAWPLTIAMLSLAGIPATGGFIGKFFLIDAAVDGGYAWLGIVIVIGSMISLGYYLRVVAAIWMRDAPAPATGGSVSAAAVAGARPVLAGGSGEPDADGGASGGSTRLGGGPAGSTRLEDDASGSVAAPAGVAATARGRAWELDALAILFGAATIAAGVVPQPLFEFVQRAGAGLTGLL